MEKKEPHCQYCQCQVVDTILYHQRPEFFKDTYLFPLNYKFTVYSSIPTIGLIVRLNGKYSRILGAYLVAKYTHLQDTYNPNETPKSVYMRIN